MPAALPRPSYALSPMCTMATVPYGADRGSASGSLACKHQTSKGPSHVVGRLHVASNIAATIVLPIGAAVSCQVLRWASG